MHDFYIIRICNRNANLLDDFSRVDFVLQEESGNTCFRITVDNRPIDRSSTTILGKQRSMQVKCPQTGHIPDNFRQHAESNYDLQVGFPFTQSLHKAFILQFLRLQQRQIMV